MGDVFVAGLIAAGGMGEGTKGCAKVLLIEGAAKVWHVHGCELEAQFIIHNLHSLLVEAVIYCSFFMIRTIDFKCWGIKKYELPRRPDIHSWPSKVQ
jgi:hypothetical protein